MNKKDKAQRSAAVQRFLADSDRHHIAATEWLLLDAVRVLKKASLKMIEKKIISTWKKIHKHDPNFFLVFPKSNDGHNLVSMTTQQQVHRFFEIGLVGVCLKKSSEIAYFYITKKGRKTLVEWQPEVKQYLRFVHFKRGSRK